MRRSLFFRFLPFFLIVLSGCAHSIHESYTSDFRDMKSGARQISSEATQFAVMGFVTDTKYVEVAMEDLQRQCQGRITGITTTYSTSLGFFSWTNKLKMSAYCIN